MGLPFSVLGPRHLWHPPLRRSGRQPACVAFLSKLYDRSAHGPLSFSTRKQVGSRVASEFAIEWPLLKEKWWILACGILLQVTKRPLDAFHLWGLPH